MDDYNFVTTVRMENSMRYSYIGTVSKGVADSIIRKHKNIVITGEWANGKVDLGVPSDLPDRVIDIYINRVSEGRI